MKIKIHRLAAVLLLSTLNPQLSTVFAQGSLTPPGAPAPTMKTLAQIEPRTPISGPLPYSITSGGSYYLTTNLVGASGQNGITISSGNVTLDLNGFALLGVPGSLRGVYVAGTYTNLTVRNGTVSGWGDNGVDGYSTGSSRNLVFERLTVSANGGDGIRTEAASVVRDCLSQGNLSDGIFSAGGLISGCVVRDNGSGIRGANCIVQNCQSSDNNFYGIYVAPGTVSHCLVQNNGYSGIYVDAPGSEVIGNNCIENNPGTNAFNAGIYINDSRNRIEDNHVTAGINGIVVGNGYVNNVIIKNTVIGNGGYPFFTPIPQAAGPIIYNIDASTGSITNSNPWANFQF